MTWKTDLNPQEDISDDNLDTYPREVNGQKY